MKNGDYTIGDLVVPKAFKKLVLKNGTIKSETFMLESRKIRLSTIRRRTAEKHEKYMRCNSVDSLSIEDIIHYLKKINEFIPTDSEDVMRSKVASFQQTRHFQLWHDASTLCNHGVAMRDSLGSVFTNDVTKRSKIVLERCTISCSALCKSISERA